MPRESLAPRRSKTILKEESGNRSGQFGTMQRDMDFFEEIETGVAVSQNPLMSTTARPMKSGNAEPSAW